MGWKDWTYWLKGGIIFGILGFLIGYGSYVINGKCYAVVEQFSCGYYSIISPANILAGIILFVPSFLIGSFFGWIYGKIKKK